jgi:hypothetical protein
MKGITILFAALLAVLPAAAFARQCGQETANRCEAGMVWDEDSAACVKIVTG